jgi:hypothetical protein
MEYCCPHFKARLAERNERGSSIYVCPPTMRDHEPSFVLLSRGINKGAEAVLDQIPRGTPLEINISSRARFHFCPWCGRELKRFYAESYRSLIDPEILAEMKEDGGLTSGQSATPVKCPVSNHRPPPGVAHP